MKRILIGIAAIGSLLTTSALGADLAPRTYTKAPPAVVAVYDWTGFYVGGNVGYSWGNGSSTYNDPGYALIPSLNPPSSPTPMPTSISQSQKIDGLIGGLQIGYNWQPDKNWVFGLEADFQGSGEKGSSNYSAPYAICVDGCIGGPSSISQGIASKILWFGTVRGRVGVLVNPTLLVYGTGGLAYGSISVSGSATDVNGWVGPPAFGWSFGKSATNFGWTLGAGIEGAIANSSNWTWKAEYLYIDLGSVSGSGIEPDFLTTYNWKTKVTDNILRVGVNYRFGGPVVAKY